MACREGAMIVISLGRRTGAILLKTNISSVSVRALKPGEVCHLHLFLNLNFVSVCHAEMNACFNKNCADISNCVIYTILFPCNQCAKTIIQSGITEVVYLGDKNMNKPEAQAAKRMFEASGVKCRCGKLGSSLCPF